MANGVTLNAMFKLQDQFTKVISRVTTGTERATSSLNTASRAADKLGTKLTATSSVGSSGILRLASSANTASRSAGRMGNEFKNAGDNGSIGVNKLSGSLGRLISIAALVTGALKGMSISDEYMGTKARIDMMNDGLQTTKELQDMIMQSANRSKGSYTEMSASVAKLGVMSGDAFGSSKEIVGFMELVQKSFKIGGASGSEQSAGMLQLSQAMASGRLQGDEFRSITENAPMIANAIASHLKVTKGKLKELSSDGLITSDIIKEAMFSAADDINQKFSTIPIMWNDVWKLIKNGAIDAFDDVIEKVSDLINTEEFETFIDSIITGFHIAATGAGLFIAAIIKISNVVSSVWSVVSSVFTAMWPLFVGIAVAAIPMIIASVGGLIASLWSLVFPMLANVALWMMANAPLIILVGCIMLVIKALGDMGMTFEMVCGFIGGIIGGFVGVFYNYFVYIHNVVGDFINFWGNVFKNPIAAVQKLFYDMSVNVLGFMENIAKGIEDLLNSIPGIEVDITSNLTNLKNKLQAESDKIADKNQFEEIVKKKEFWDLGDSVKKGSEIGSKAGAWVDDGIGKIGDYFNGVLDKTKTVGNDATDNLFNDGLPVANKKGKNLDVKMSNEDIKYLRDLADKEYVAKFNNNTLAPNVTIQFGDVHETADAKQVSGIIERILVEEIATVKEG